MDVKTCKQCGELRPIDQFRRYYGGRRGNYKTCKVCERINSREKYLTGKGDNRSADENIELMQIHTLYERQRAVGLQPPAKHERRKPLAVDLDSMIKKYEGMYPQIANETPPADAVVEVAPYELTRWLTEKLTDEPDFYLDTIYEALKEKYRPCTGINKDTMMPTYDNTYKGVLDRILDRFNDYEDSYYNEGAE